MVRREVHAAVLIDDGRLQRFRELDEPCDPRRRTRQPVGDDHRVLCVHEEARGFRHRARVTLRGRRRRQLRHAQPCGHFGRNRILLESTIDNDQNRHHRWRHGDLVGSHGRFGEVGE